MTPGAAAGHPTVLDAPLALPAEVEVDTPLALAVRVACAHGCDLGGLPVEVTGAGGVLAAAELAAGGEGEIRLRAPREVGAQAWTLRFPGHARAAAAHAESTLPIRFRTVPHACTLTAWGDPSPAPAAAGGALPLHVGLRCGQGCRLDGARVAVLDGAGAQAAAAVLGATPWPGTEALYWAALEAQAPTVEGVHAWSAVLTAGGVELPHAAPPAAFGFRTGQPLAHRAALRVVQAAGRAPLAGVEVRLGPYVGVTDLDGVAAVAVPAGAFEVSIRKIGFEAQPFRLAVERDVTLEVAAERAPTPAERHEAALRNYPWG